MSYKHGVYIQEQETSILPAVSVDSAIPVVFGTAPIENQDAADRKINVPVLCYSYAEAVAAFGYSDDWESYTLCEFMKSQFGQFGVGPVVFVNVYDPATHVDDEDNPDPSKVSASDIIGGVADDGTLTGLELVDQVYSRFRVLPGILCAPGFSTPAVCSALANKCTGINSIFGCIAVADIPIAEVTAYTDVAAYKADNNLLNPNLILCWPQVALDDVTYHLSTQLAGLMGSVDASAGDIPYKSPSNHQLNCNAAVASGKEIWLGLEQANYLNGQGVVTALNFIGGWKAWGNRTSAYPSNTDVKDAFIPIRRFFNWHANTFISTWWQRVDFPITRRLIQTIIDSENIRLNGLRAREIILGGRITFVEGENTTVDLMDGLLTFHTYLTPPSPARAITNILEYDPTALKNLFGSSS